jgi:hypothetical protein
MCVQNRRCRLTLAVRLAEAQRLAPLEMRLEDLALGAPVGAGPTSTGSLSVCEAL